MSNTDLGSGHGTHVAGIIAADGHTGPEHVGVAPDASLVCLAIGEVLFTTAVVTAYDHLMDQPGMWGVDVINNSWGNTYAQFDPRNPINVATKAITDLGVDVVFAAGNSGDGNGEGADGKTKVRACHVRILAPRCAPSSPRAGSPRRVASPRHGSRLLRPIRRSKCRGKTAASAW